MWTQYFRFGLISLLLLLFVNCDRHTTNEERGIQNFIYSNKLAESVTIEGYFSNEGTPGFRTIDIANGDSFKESPSHGSSLNEQILYDCDSVRMIFGTTKELWYYRSKGQSKKGNIFLLDNYTIDKVSETETNYNYQVNQSIYDLAADIAN